MGEGKTVDSQPYRWPWHGAFCPGRTALLVLVDGERALPDEETTDRLRRLARAAHALGVTVGEAPGEGAASLLSPDLVDFVVQRPHFGGFVGADLDSVLRRRLITDLILVGFPFELGADCTMRQANDLGYECLALTDCNTGLAPDTLAGALASIQMSGGIFGAVAPVAAVLRLFVAATLADSIPSKE